MRYSSLTAKERFIVDYLIDNHKLHHNDVVSSFDKRSDDTPIYYTFLSLGLINNFDLSCAKASFYQLPFLDLNISQPDLSLLVAKDRFLYLRYKCIPHHINNMGLIVLATVDVTSTVKDWADLHYGIGRYCFSITSPYDIHWSIQRYFSAEDDHASREFIFENHPNYSAKSLFGPVHLFIFLTFITLSVICIAAMPHASLIYFLIFSNVIYFLFILFKVFLFTVGLARYPAPCVIHDEEPPAQYPIYSILVPLYQEKRTLPHLVKSIYDLDYPKDKLDVKFIVESDDYVTIEALKALRCPASFEIIRVPYSEPRTKAKACNYALRFIKGEYVTIFDAEDRPEPSQLREALSTISCNQNNLTVGVQAKLNYYNRCQNNLTALFAIEYAVWFEFLLRGLLRLGIPIPLGGTSNHLKCSILNELHAWDPYNVTEDADLGLRIAYSGYRIDLIHSTTWEEAPHTIRTWIRQRSRWIKGYIQTYFVHMRSPLKAYRKFGLIGFIGFQLFVGAPSLVYIVSPILWLVALIVLFTDLHSSYYYFTQLTLFNFLLGGVVHTALGFIAIIRYQWWSLSLHCLLFPFYWVLHSLASFRAVWQLFTSPHYWDKTSHGHSL